MDNILTVSELTVAIKKQLETRFPLVSVKGEISNFKEQASGHLYFTLKDAEAQISAVLFRGNTRGLARMPKGGDQVVVKGEITVYPPRGNYQIIVRELQYAGVGELLLKLHELKTKLENKGWFDAARKKPLPKMPKTIGVVTSPTGAVIQDILNILNRRFSGVHVILNPVKVQGEGAAQEIAQAIDQFNRHGLADVLIVGRGGGSLEDLWAFNEEAVALAIYNSKIPVISAVGHETDFSIADYVADVRAPTPSAAAEIVVAEKIQHLSHLMQTKRQLQQTVQHLLRACRHRLDGIARQPVFSSPYAILGNAAQRLDDLNFQIAASAKNTLQSKKLRLQGIERQAAALKPSLQVQALKQKLGQLAAHLRAIDPRNLLTKGYCILFRENAESVIFSSKELCTDDTVRIQMHDGKVKATINERIL
jgi:exodeoxyribonuclease VII large subunit